MDELSPAARRTDPWTSHAAAEEITASGQRATHTRIVAELVTRHPGLTSRELAEKTNLDRYEVARRLPDARAERLVSQGPARTCEVAGRAAVTWYPRIHHTGTAT